MNPTPLSPWDRTQLAFLRTMSSFLGLVDSLLKVQWGEHLLERMSHRWQGKLQQLNQALANLEDERNQIHEQLEALALHTATLCLGGRKLTYNELSFDPAIPHDDQLLDASIALLVKQRLATIESREIEPGHFIYYLEPDWAAIHSRLRTAAGLAEPETAEWFREGLRFIEESLLPQNEIQRGQSPANLDTE
jgi:hypothetical protein